MCGVAGYSGIKDPQARLTLACMLGYGIDKRGGHAAGYVSIDSHESGKGFRLAKRIGTWGEANKRFLFGAAKGEVAMMHARFATHGPKENFNCAHPFAIRRNDETVLVGVHNGVIQGTMQSALTNKRPWSVDSKEVFELLADEKYDEIRALSGYGVLTWITPASGLVNVCKLSAGADFMLTHLEGGGVAWASTWMILREALKIAKMKDGNTIHLPEVGTVYQIGPEGVAKSGVTGLHTQGSKSSTSYSGTSSGDFWYRNADGTFKSGSSFYRDNDTEYSPYGTHYGYTAEDRERDRQEARQRRAEEFERGLRQRNLTDTSNGNHDAGSWPSYSSRVTDKGDGHSTIQAIFNASPGDKVIASDGIEWVRVQAEDGMVSWKRTGETLATIRAREDLAKAAKAKEIKEANEATRELNRIIAKACSEANTSKTPTLPCVRVAENVLDTTDTAAADPVVTCFELGDADSLDLENMTDEELDTITDDQWDAICDAYRNDTRATG